MELKRALRLAMLVLCLQVTGGTALAGEGPLAAAEAESRAGAATPEGAQFGQTVGEAFGREHPPTISRCAKETRRPDLSNFDLLLRVDAAGSVAEVLVKPSTNLAECVRAKLKGWKAGVPPREGFWVTVAVKLNRK